LWLKWNHTQIPYIKILMKCTKIICQWIKVFLYLCIKKWINVCFTIYLQSLASFCLSSGLSQFVSLKYPSTKYSCITSWWGKALPRANIVAFPGVTCFVTPLTIPSSPIFLLFARSNVYTFLCSKCYPQHLE